jgi:hypothetical protein
MLHHIIQNFSFGRLLAIATSYSIGSSLCALLIADGLARIPALWPHLMSMAAAVLN